MDAAVATVLAAVDTVGSANGYGTAETHASSAESEGDRQGGQGGEYLGRGGSDCVSLSWTLFLLICYYPDQQPQPPRCPLPLPGCRYGTRESRGRCLWDTSIIADFLASACQAWAQLFTANTPLAGCNAGPLLPPDATPEPPPCAGRNARSFSSRRTQRLRLRRQRLLRQRLLRWSLLTPDVTSTEEEEGAARVV